MKATINTGGGTVTRENVKKVRQHDGIDSPRVLLFYREVDGALDALTLEEGDEAEAFDGTVREVTP